MSRLDDIIDLIQTTNEVYFITAPGRVRTAYILVDDIVELTLKTFLQEKTLERRRNCQSHLKSLGWIANHNRGWLRRYLEEEIDLTELSNRLVGKPGTSNIQTELSPFEPLQHWSANNPSARNTFDTVINEVKPFFPPSASGVAHPASDLLDEALQRHTTRNKFYHDHHQTGLTIDDDKCLRALCDLFDLMEHLFPGFIDKVKQNHTVRCQIGVLRLKKTASVGQMELSQPYSSALDQIKKGHQYDIQLRAIEHSLVHTVSDRFFRALCEQFKNKIAELQIRVDRINGMLRPQRKHLDEKTDKQQLIQILQGQLDQINVLLGTP